MVAPITPTTRQYNLRKARLHPYWGTWSTHVYLAYLRTGYNQKFPYNVDTSLYVDIGETLSDFGTAEAWNQSPETGVAADGAANQARARFVGKLGDSSSFGATLTTELRSSWRTVSGGITSCLLAARAVNKLQFDQAAKILGFYPPTEVVMRAYASKKRKKGRYTKRLYKRVYWKMPDGKRVAKSAGNRWLWYSYGVKPLISDIYNGMDVLTRPTPSTKVKGTGSHSWDSGVGGDFYQTHRIFKSSVRCSAHVRVKNSNLWLANQLGLINPVQFFIEGIKLSFVIDWFSNLSQVVMQMTDFVGLEITRPMTTSKHVLDYLQFHPDYSMRMDSRRTILRRVQTLPTAKLTFAYERFQWQRGLNAISLLLGVLKNRR